MSSSLFAHPFVLCVQLEEDLQGLTALKECLLSETVALTSVDLMFNRIGTNIKFFIYS